MPVGLDLCVGRSRSNPPSAFIPPGAWVGKLKDGGFRNPPYGRLQRSSLLTWREKESEGFLTAPALRADDDGCIGNRCGLKNDHTL